VTPALHKIPLLAPLTLALALVACGPDDTPVTPDLAENGGKVIDTKQLVVEPSMRGCANEEFEVYTLCQRISAADDDYDYSYVWGLEHEWGHRYTLEINVVEMPVEWTYGDGSLLEFELVKVIDEQIVVAEEFELPTYAFNIQPGASSGTLVDQTPIICATPEVCDAIAAVPDALDSPMVRVRFGETHPLPLVVIELLEGG
jgi:hypothetical protein